VNESGSNINFITNWSSSESSSGENEKANLELSNKQVHPGFSESSSHPTISPFITCPAI
jgi:hypothetical protein